ncbi:SIP domain-containing protein [Streptomyces sp. NPDC050433]|uniref:SIP domain-containing protein n=1 Tax=unclassified Streptomyces TaxID=2593676 RepID=UPI003436999C
MLLAGDGSALPAIGTITEALPEGAHAVAYVEVWDGAEEQRFESAGEVTVCTGCTVPRRLVTARW